MKIGEKRREAQRDIDTNIEVAYIIDAIRTSLPIPIRDGRVRKD